MWISMHLAQFSIRVVEDLSSPSISLLMWNSFRSISSPFETLLSACQWIDWTNRSGERHHLYLVFYVSLLLSRVFHVRHRFVLQFVMITPSPASWKDTHESENQVMVSSQTTLYHSPSLMTRQSHLSHILHSWHHHSYPFAFFACVPIESSRLYYMQSLYL